MPYRDDDFEEYETTAPSFVVSKRSDNFVAAPPRQYQRVEILPPAPVELQAPGPVRSVSTLTTSHLDRAKGFSLATLPLAIAVGFGALLIGLLFFSLDLWSLAAITTLFLGFLATWLVAWIVYQLASPDGVSLFSTWAHYQLLRQEQKARLARMHQSKRERDL